MTAKTDESFLAAINEMARSLSDSFGLCEADATALARELTDEIRDKYGAESVYIHREATTVRDQEIRARAKGTKNRDELCDEYGISRSAFYRIIAKR